jgi:threonine dehydrogenase-like Zn-dependent dehydrogenase
MRALVVDANHQLSLKDVPEPAREGECRVRVLMAGICGTDLQLLEGYADFQGIPGHEFVGIVEDAPPADANWIGKRVVGEINVGCGRCEWCRRGVREHCTAREVVGIRGRAGAFAEFMWLPAVNLHEVPGALGDQAAVFVEPAAAACRILEQIPVNEQTSVAVVGDGRLGLLVGQVLAAVARTVVVLGRHESKVGIARDLGLHAEIDRSSNQSGNSEKRFDVVVDATGRPEGIRRALDLVHPRGLVVLKSTFHGEAPLESWPIVVDEVTIVGSRCGPFRRGIEFLASGKVRTAPLVSRVAALDEYQSAFDEARRTLKVLFDLGSTRPDRAPRASS